MAASMAVATLGGLSNRYSNRRGSPQVGCLGAYDKRLGFLPRGQAEGDWTEPDGRVVHGVTRRIERDASEEQRP